MPSESPQGVPSRIKDFVTSFSYFSHVPAVRFFLSNSLFDVEFVDKKNCIFSFFHIFKIRGASTNTANYQLWPTQPALYRCDASCETLSLVNWASKIDDSAWRQVTALPTLSITEKYYVPQLDSPRHHKWYFEWQGNWASLCQVVLRCVLQKNWYMCATLS